MSQSTMHQWARYYAQQGWHVFPLVPGTKSPFKDSKGSTEATTDLAQIDKWWGANPEANIGTRPAAGGLYVYDVDPRNGGSESHAQLEAQHGPITSGLTVDSPGGGFHLYMLAPQDRTKVYQSQPAQGIDGKYNGYAVLPPSLHPNGRRYEWRGGVNPTTSMASPIPAWLVRERHTARVPDAAAGERINSLEDAAKILTALEGRDPDDYHLWEQAIASIRHWEEHTPGAEGVGYELARQWSERSPKHDDGQFEDKWNSHDSFKEGARGIGSLFHEAGMTAAQRAPDTGAVFAAFPPVIQNPPQPVQWTTQPVPEFKGSRDPSELVAGLLNQENGRFAGDWNAGKVELLIGSCMWKCGGCCETALQMLLLNPAVADTETLRAWIAHDGATRSTWDTVGKLSFEQIQAGSLLVQVDEGKWVSAERALRNALPHVRGLFKRDGELVFVDERGRIGRHDVHTLSSDLEAAVRLEKGGKGAPAKMPEGLARRILGRSNYTNVNEIRAAVPLSVVRPDGTVAFEQGLDVATGLYIIRGGQPARVLGADELKEAVARVWAPFALFPYVDDGARAVTFAAMLTTVCRPAMETAPAFIVNAQTPGTGKTLLSEAVLGLTGETVEAVSIKADATEQGKQLGAILDTGPLTVLFDNVFGVLKASSDLCSTLTSPVYKARILGQSKTISLANRAVWFLNGNNVSVVGDMNRRILPINLDSGEHPERRQFDFNPVQAIRGSLDNLRADLINILATYRAQGMATVRLDGYASFEAWNRLVRGCVVWLGWADPLKAMQDQQADDLEVNKLAILAEAWKQRFGDAEKSLRDLKTEVVDVGSHPLWLEAVDAICTDASGRLNEARLGYFLRDMRGRRIGKSHFQYRAGTGNVRYWKLHNL